MKELEERIKEEAIVLPGDVVKVGGFINQLVDINLLSSMAKEVKRLFSTKIDKVLTIEASGLPFATAIALEYNVPMVFAKKSLTSNVSGDVIYSPVYSYTHKSLNYISINKEYIKKDESVLIADDFLALGNALSGLIDLTEKCGGKVVGCAIQVEKEYQNGGNKLRDLGYRVESLAKIKAIENNEIIF